MKIGVPKESKQDEYRVAMVPSGVDLLVRNGHTVFIEKNAGMGSSIGDEDYVKAGAKILDSRKEVFDTAEMIVKVKEPLPDEYPLIKKDQIVFTYFHFAAAKPLTEAMIARQCVCLAYETIEKPDGSLPLLIPMSEVAGRMAIQEGAKYLEKPMEGRGILLGGVPGVAPANVAIIGGGIVGSNAARVAAGLGARVSILDVNMDRLRYLSDIMPSNVITLFSNAYTVQSCLRHADLVVGAVLVSGGRTPTLVPRAYLKLMKPGSVIVDVAIDQGGCVETSAPTTHSKPIFKVDGVVHYCVTNMPGAVGNTSTYALTNVTMPYVLEVANLGWKKATQKSLALRKGLNIVKGEVTHPAVAESLGYAFKPAEQCCN